MKTSFLVTKRILKVVFERIENYAKTLTDHNRNDNFKYCEVIQIFDLKTNLKKFSKSYSQDRTENNAKTLTAHHNRNDNFKY